MIELPDPPPTLGRNCRAFYDELREMLVAVKPAKVSDADSKVVFLKTGLEVTLAHVDDPNWTVGANMDEDNSIVWTGLAHENFYAGDPPEDGRSWTTVMVDFMAEALEGEIEILTVRRGSRPVEVEHFMIGPDGSRTSLGRTAMLRPHRAMVWLPKSESTERISFV